MLKRIKMIIAFNMGFVITFAMMKSVVAVIGTEHVR